ncbi:MAG: acetate--CoA ligase family protein [Burkholderiales bacterium]|nr:acetate--CoA ligase family protein [Burkholderiales bacterium]
MNDLAPRRSGLRPSFEAMHALLCPSSVAIVGATPREGSLGQRLFTHIRGWRYGGSVYAVNPAHAQIDGQVCFPSLAALPRPVDLVAFAVNDDRLEAALDDAALHGAKAGVIFGRLYRPGADGPARKARLAAIARGRGMALCGSNCMGFINVAAGLRMSGNPPPVEGRGGGISIISHSGSTWSGLVGSQRDFPLGFAISAGEELATTMANYIDFLLGEGSTRAIALVIETVRDPQDFIAAADRASARGVPLAALKLGRSDLGKRFALSHSGALAGADAVYEAIFARHNIASCRSLDELADTLELLASSRKPARGALGATTDSGAERQLVADLAVDVGCPLATFSATTEARLQDVLDPGMLPENPVDIYGDGKMVLAECLDAVAQDEGVAVVAMVSNLVEGRPRLMGMVKDAMTRAVAATDKPLVVLSNVHSTVSRSAAREFRAQGIPVLMSTATGLHAIKRFLQWHERRDRAAPAAAPDSTALVRKWRARLRSGTLDAHDGLTLFADFGGDVAASVVARSAADAIAAAERFGYPVTLKTANPTILHKTEAGGVALSLQSSQAVEAAYARIATVCGPAMQVQKQVSAGVEIILGMVRDPAFGPVMTFGLGGVFVEVLRDTITVIPPVSAGDVRGMLPQLRGYPLLQGARGTAKVDLDKLAAAIASFSHLAAALGDELDELDLNPVIAGPWGATAVDALVATRKPSHD